MTFNGRDLLTFCGAGVSINKEIPPATTGRSITTIGGAGGHILGHVEDAPQTYTARINLHGQTMSAAWNLKRKLAQWARTDTLADLIPTHDTSRKYRAIVQSISDPEFKWGACTVDVVFLIPDARMISTSSATTTGTGYAAFTRTGTSDPILKVTFTPSAAVSNPKITINGTVVFGVTGTVGANVPCIVDFDAKTLKVNGSYAMNRISYAQTNWHPVYSTYNTVGVPNAAISIEVTQRWL